MPRSREREKRPTGSGEKRADVKKRTCLNAAVIYRLGPSGLLEL